MMMIIPLDTRGLHAGQRSGPDNNSLNYNRAFAPLAARAIMLTIKAASACWAAAQSKGLNIGM